MIDVDLSGMEPGVPPSTRAEDSLSLNLRGALEQLWQASPAAPSSPSKYITSRAQLVSSALGAPPPAGETENSPRSVGTEHYPCPSSNSLTNFSQVTPPSGSPSSAQSTIKVIKPFWMTGPRTLEAGSMPYIKGPLASSEGEPTSLSKEMLQLQEERNTALGGVA